MNIENIKEENGIYYYPTSSFATISIKYKFILDNDIKTLVTAIILSNYLIKANKIYKTSKEVRDKAKELYNASIGTKQNFIGSKNFFNFTINFLNPKIIKEDYFEEVIQFAKDILYKPNFDNGKLNKEIIEEIKKDLILKAKSELANPQISSKRKLLKEIIPNSNYTRNLIIDLEEEKQTINSITDKDIIDLYNKTINNKSFYKAYIFGDINEKEYKLITKTFPFKSNMKNLDYKELINIPKGSKEDTSNEIKTSTISVIYQLNNYTPDKLHLYKTLTLMLNGSNGLILRTLRNELNIVYSAGAYINKYRFFGILIIEAKISNENKEKCLKGIDEIFNKLIDKKIVKELLDYAIDEQNEEKFLSDENVDTIITDLENYVFNTRPSREELIKQINNITVDDIINEIKNIEKKYIYYFKGVKDE